MTMKLVDCPLQDFTPRRRESFDYIALIVLETVVICEFDNYQASTDSSVERFG